MIKFKPFGVMCLIEKPKFEEKTKTGIIKSEKMIKEEESKASVYLEIFATGDSVTETKVGDKVLLNTGNHNVIKIEGKEYFLVSQGMLLGKLL